MMCTELFSVPVTVDFAHVLYRRGCFGVVDTRATHVDGENWARQLGIRMGPALASAVTSTARILAGLHVLILGSVV